MFRISKGHMTKFAPHLALKLMKLTFDERGVLHGVVARKSREDQRSLRGHRPGGHRVGSLVWGSRFEHTVDYKVFENPIFWGVT